MWEGIIGNHYLRVFLYFWGWSYWIRLILLSLVDIWQLKIIFFESWVRLTSWENLLILRPLLLSALIISEILLCITALSRFSWCCLQPNLWNRYSYSLIHYIFFPCLNFVVLLLMILRSIDRRLWNGGLHVCHVFVFKV